MHYSSRGLGAYPTANQTNGKSRQNGFKFQPSTKAWCCRSRCAFVVAYEQLRTSSVVRHARSGLRGGCGITALIACTPS